MKEKLGENTHFYEAVADMTKPDFLNAVSRHLDWLTLIAAVRSGIMQILDGEATIQKATEFCDANYPIFSGVLQKHESFDPEFGDRLLERMIRETTSTELVYIFARLKAARVFSDVEPLYPIHPDVVWSCFPEVVFHDDRKVTRRKMMTPRIPDTLRSEVQECLDDRFLSVLSLFIEAEVMWDQYKLDMMPIRDLCPNIVSICTATEEYYEKELNKRYDIYPEVMEHVETILHDVLFQQKYADPKRIELLKQKFASLEDFDDLRHSKAIYPVVRSDFIDLIESPETDAIRDM